MTEPVLLILRHTEDENSWSNKQRRIEPEAILLKPGRRSLDRSRAYVYMLQLQCGADLRCLFGIIGNVSNREREHLMDINYWFVRSNSCEGFDNKRTGTDNTSRKLICNLK